MIYCLPYTLQLIQHAHHLRQAKPGGNNCYVELQAELRV